MRYKRILLKLSGESLMGSQGSGIDPEQLSYFASEVKSIVDKGVQVAIVIGGGNIFRGLKGAADGFDRLQGDYMGMLATIINSVALQSEFTRTGVGSRLMSGVQVESLTEKVYGPKAIEYLEAGEVVIISGGTGNPYFTTDTASALRALEIKADAILKGTRVDGIYSADPEKVPDAEFYPELSYNEALEKQLKVMDLTAFALCSENKLPIVVFNMNVKGNLGKVVEADGTGSIVH
jgi:uridylate kinase